MEAAKPAGKRPRNKYDAAFRLEAVRRVSQDGQAPLRVAQALGMSEAILGKWVRAARAQAARPAGSEALEQENKQLRVQLARTEMERDILKSADHLFASDGPMKRFAFVALHAHRWPVRQQCQLLGVSPSGLGRLAKTGAQPGGRARTCRLASSRPTRVHHPCRPLGPTPPTGPAAA